MAVSRSKFATRRTTIMKIIDKNKDYYDYLQGVWGQDPKAIYARTGSVKLRPQDRPFFFSKELPKGVQAWQGELILTCGAIAHHIYFENTGHGVITEEFLSHDVVRPEGAAPLLLEWFLHEFVEINHGTRVYCPKPYNKEYFCQLCTDQALGTVSALTKWRSSISKRRHEKIQGRYENPILSTIPLLVVSRLKRSSMKSRAISFRFMTRKSRTNARISRNWRRPASTKRHPSRTPNNHSFPKGFVTKTVFTRDKTTSP